MARHVGVRTRQGVDHDRTALVIVAPAEVGRVDRSGPGWVGKSGEVVKPATYALPRVSTAMPRPSSDELPPRYVEKTRAEPIALSFATKASTPPPKLRCNAPNDVGKSLEMVSPIT